LETLIGGTGKDTIDMSDSSLYIPSADTDVITWNMSKGSGYTLISSDTNFQYAKMIGGTTTGTVIIDGSYLDDSDFALLNQANIGSLNMRTTSNNTVILADKAKASGLNGLTMSDGDDTIDVSAFYGDIVVSGEKGDDIIKTSFAYLSDLTFTGGTGIDTLQIVGSDARTITSLKGGFDVLQLNAGNNFVQLSDTSAAGISTIIGGTGYDTFNMLSLTTGINFVMDATKLGTTSTYARLDGSTAQDTLTVNYPGTNQTFTDSLFTRVGSVSWAGDLGAIENFVTDSDGHNTYNFGATAELAGITTVYAHASDILNASGSGISMNFVLDLSDLSSSTITGTASTDTLTLTTNGTLIDTAFVSKTFLETLVLANGSNDITLSTNSATTGIKLLVGGTGDDKINTSAYTTSATIYGGAGNDSLVAGSVADTLVGSNSTAIGANEKDTLTGGTGNDRFILGDTTNAYYNTGSRANDYAVITSFDAGDKIALKDLSSLYTPTSPATNNYGYLAGTNDIYTIGNLGVSVNSYIYADTDKTGTITTGDNLIAAVNSTAGALTQADLLTSKFTIL